MLIDGAHFIAHWPSVCPEPPLSPSAGLHAMMKCSKAKNAKTGRPGHPAAGKAAEPSIMRSPVMINNDVIIFPIGRIR